MSDIRSSVYAQDTKRTNSCTLSTAREVDDAIRTGQVQVAKTGAGYYLDSDRQHSRLGGNYYDHCVRGSIFGAFLHKANKFMLKHPLFDVMLQTHMVTYGGADGKNITLVDCPWMYYWRRHEDSVCAHLQREQYSDRMVSDRLLCYCLTGDWKTAVEFLMDRLSMSQDRAMRYTREFLVQCPRHIQERVGMPTSTRIEKRQSSASSQRL